MTTTNAEDPTFFASPAEFQHWLARNSEEQTELWVGYCKRNTGLPSITWPESVDEALCAGWIDGVRKRIDDERYKIRFTRRRPKSVWSAVNIKRVVDLEAEGRVRPSGRAAFEQRQARRSAVYAYEQTEQAALNPEQERLFRSNPAAWEYFQRQAPRYKRTAIWLIVSAKRPETKAKRLVALIEASADGRPVEPLRRT